MPFRVRALCFLARHLGTEAVLPLMLRTEAAEADRYRDDAEATDAMAQQEAAAGRTIAAMQGIPEGGRIAASEGRHRAEHRRACCGPPCSASTTAWCRTSRW